MDPVDDRPLTAVIGGSGFYSFLSDPRTLEVDTPYGAPSAPISLGEVAGTPVAFLPRHGLHHEYPPHAIPFRANIWALRSLGVRQILGPCAVGGLQESTPPGAVVVPDQLVDRTTGRIQTFIDKGAAHAPFADPYCPRLRQALVGAAPDIADGGTMVVIEGPRFSTRAESQWYAAQGWELVNMTGHPEAVLARELGVCYATVALVTDLDAGVEEGAGVDQAQVFALFAENLERLKTLLTDTIGTVATGPGAGGCTCAAWHEGVQLPFELP